MRYFKVVDEVSGPEGDLYRFGDDERLQMKIPNYDHWIDSAGNSVEQLRLAVADIVGTITEVEAP
jgi:hypothetical protein